MLKEKLRIQLCEIIAYPNADLMAYVVGKGILNNPNIIRLDDLTNGDIVFYEQVKSTST